MASFTDCISSNNDCPSIKGRAKYIHMNDKRTLTRKGIEDQHCIIQWLRSLNVYHGMLIGTVLRS